MWNIVLTFKNDCTVYCYQISVVTLWKVLSCFPLLIIYYITCIQWSKYDKQITTNTFIFFNQSRTMECELCRCMFLSFCFFGHSFFMTPRLYVVPYMGQRGVLLVVFCSWQCCKTFWKKCQHILKSYLPWGIGFCGSNALQWGRV